MQQLAEEHEIVKRAQQGEMQAFRQLFEFYHKPVYNFVARMIGRQQDAEDVVQEVFIKIYQKLATLRDVRLYCSWMFSIAKNESITFTRKNRGHFTSLDGDKNDGLENVAQHHHRPPKTPDRQAIDNELERLVQSALDELPDNYRAAFILGVLEGYSYKEVAQMLGCTVANIKTRVFRARAALSDKLGQYFNSVNELEQP